jgi:steroid 5-alpha reductase family enzyme
VTALLIAVPAVFAVQWLAFVPAALARTERYFDFTGAVTFVVVTAGLAVASAPLDARGWLLASLVVVWALRLGTFLFARVRRVGEDARFDRLKRSRLRFFGAWTLQGVWIAVTASTAWVAIAVGDRVALDGWAVAGVAVWLAGFALEVVADEQKRRFKADAGNSGAFITSGAWAASRHPNYLGEIALWTGVAIIAVPTLSGWQWLSLASPVFVAVLLLSVSGIPILEARARERWGGHAEFEDYMQTTPVLVPTLASIRHVMRGRRTHGQ